MGRRIGKMVKPDMRNSPEKWSVCGRRRELLKGRDGEVIQGSDIRILGKWGTGRRMAVQYKTKIEYHTHTHTHTLKKKNVKTQITHSEGNFDPMLIIDSYKTLQNTIIDLTILSNPFMWY